MEHQLQIDGLNYSCSWDMWDVDANEIIGFEAYLVRTEDDVERVKDEHILELLYNLCIDEAVDQWNEHLANKDYYREETV